MHFKYIVFRNLSSNQLEPVIFSPNIMHLSVSSAFVKEKKEERMLYMPRSAGFCNVGANGKYICYDQSMSLGLKANPADGNLLDNTFGA